MSFPPPHMPIIPQMPFLPPGAPMMMPPNIPIPPPANGTHRPTENEKKNKFQVPTTVFVGSISDRAPDVMIKRMLQNCGSVLNWKRIQGANGKLQAFGFCEYENPEGTLRCIRLLNGWQIQDKKLIVKVDAKTKVLLDEYKKKKRQELAKKAANDTTAFKFVYEEDDDDDDDDEKKKKSSNSSDADGKKKSGEEGEIEEEEEDYLDEATRREDHAISQSLETIMREYSREMNQRALEARDAAVREAQAAAVATPPGASISTPPPPVEPTETSPVGKRIDPAAVIDDEEGKRSLITNEIQMFRDRFKDEDTKMRNTEKERKDRYERERALQREKRLAEESSTNNNNASPSSRDASPPTSSSRDRSSPPPRRERPSTTSNRRDRSSPSEDRYRNSSSRNNTSNSVRSRTNDRRSPPPSNRYDRRSPPSRSYRRSRTKSPVVRTHSPEDEDDESYERKKQEKRLKEKEARYRDRLKAWTQRERKKQAEYKTEKQRELDRSRDEEKEAKRLLAFLEEYKDESEDNKHYKGSALVRRLKEREIEIQADKRDCRHEKEEIEELREKLVKENHSDVEGEIKRRLEKEEEHVRRRLADLIRSSSDESAGESDNDDENRPTNRKENIPTPNESSTMKIDSPKIEIKTSPKQTSALGGAPITGTKIASKRKLAVNEAFRDDQDDENSSTYQKKSKLSAIPEPIGQPSPPMKDERTMTPIKGNNASTATNNAQSAQVQEEKRQAVRKLIESIPTKKEDLFKFPLDWSLLDNSLMEKRIKPWVTKKIIEYIGEEEASLTDFICGSIMSKNNAEKILSDIRVVLDDEAEVFVVKMWRLIVYEIEAKRHGLSK